jgi:hypothetical protein
MLQTRFVDIQSDRRYSCFLEIQRHQGNRTKLTRRPQQVERSHTGRTHDTPRATL